MNFKKFAVVSAIALAMTGCGIAMTACSDDNDEKTIQFTQVPQSAQTFISTYFPGEQIKSVKENKGHNVSRKFEVKFVSGLEIDFDAAGKWVDIDMPSGQTVPAGIVPDAIDSFVKANYPNLGINEISIENYGYDVELTNGYDLEFDFQGNIIKFDR